MKVIVFIITLVLYLILHVYAFLVPDWLSDIMLITFVIIIILALIRVAYLVIKK